MLKSLMKDKSISVDSFCSSCSVFVKNPRQLLKGVIALLPICFISFVVYLRITSRNGFYMSFVNEDGPVEWMTAISYLVASLVAFLIARTFSKRRYTILYLTLAIGFFLSALEEISWGQRIFGIKSPHFFQAHNIQRETNLHNLLRGYVIHKLYIIVGFYTSFAWLILRKVKLSSESAVKLFVPDNWLMLYFLPVALFYFYWDFMSSLEIFIWGKFVIRDHFIDAKQQEPTEFLQSLGFLFFVLTIWYRGLQKHSFNER